MDSQQEREVGRVGGEGGEGPERRGSTIPQGGKDFLRYVLCGCIRRDKNTVDERRPLLVGEEHTREATGSRVEDNPIETSNNADNRNKEKLTQNLQAAKKKIDDYLEENSQSLKKEKAEFERISAHLSKWIKHAKEGIEMDHVSSLVKELSEMRLDSDFANNLSTMRTRIVHLAGRSELIENLQAAKKRIDDYLEKNPGFLDEEQREEYKIRVNNFFEETKSGELKKGMEHASHILNILHKIPEAKHVKISSEVEQRVTNENVVRKKFGVLIENFQVVKKRIDDYLEKNPGFLDEEQREEYKIRVNNFSEDIKSGESERGMEHASHIFDISRKISAAKRFELMSDNWFREEMEEIKSEEKMDEGDFMGIFEKIIKQINEKRINNQGGIAEAKEELKKLGEVEEAAKSILDEILEGEMTFGKIKDKDFDPRIKLVRDYQIEQQIKEFEMKKNRNQTLNESYSVRGEGKWSKEMADAFALSWLRAYWQEKVTEVSREAVLMLIKAVPDSNERQKIWNKWKTFGLKVSIDPITGEPISEPPPSSSAGDNDPATGEPISEPPPSSSADGNAPVAPRQRIKWQD